MDSAALREAGLLSRTRPEDSVATLDVALRSGSEFLGVLRFERPAPRDWSPAERLFALAAADRAASVLAREQDRPPEGGRLPRGEFLELVQSLDAIVWEMDAESFAFTFVSDRSEHILGYPARQWMAEPNFWQERLLYPGDRDWALAFCQTATRERRDHELEYRVVRADGEVVWLRDLVRVVVDEAGKPVVLRGVMVDVSEERRARAELEQHREQLAEAEAIAGLGSWEWDVAADRITCSDGLLRLLGREPVARPDFEWLMSHVHPDDRGSFADSIERSRHTGAPFELPHRIVRSSGEVRWLLGRGRVECRDGRAVRVVATSQEITAQREAEAALRSSEESYRAIFESAADAIYILHPESGAILDANPAACALNGYSREELKRLGIGGVSAGQSPYTWETALELIHRAAAGEPQRLEWLARHRTGRPVWGDVTLRRVHVLGQKRVLATARDITERKTAEEALRASEERHRTIFDLAAEAIYVHDPESGVILDANRTACELFGRSLEDIKALGIVGLASGGAPYTEQRALEHIRAAARGERQHFEWYCGEPRGEPLWADVSLQHVRLLGQDRVLASVRNISERKVAEDALHRANGELERRVRERTEELARANRALECEIADHRAARQELQAREEHFRRLIENASDMVQLIDATGRIRYTGPSVYHLLGYTPDEIAGTDPMIYIHPDDLQETVEALTSMLGQPGMVQTAKYRVRHKDGHYRHFEAFARTLAPDSAAEGLVVNARDITERYQADEALRDSESRYRSLIENAHDIVTILDLQGRILYQSPQLQRLLGYDPEEVVGRHAIEFVHPDDLHMPVGALEEIMRTPGTTYRSEYRFLHRDGSWRYLETFGRTLVPETAEQGLIFNSRDVTERREAEAELKRQRAYFEQLITRVDHGIAVWDAAGRFEYMSPNGMPDAATREWIIGRTHHEYCEKRGLPKEVADHRQRFLSLALETRCPTEGEETIVRADGSPLHLLRRYSPVLDEAGTVERVIGYSIDITERKRAEEALRQATQEAERAREVAEHANRAKSEFLSRMSHELRTPMNSILGFAQLLDRAPLPPEHKKGIGHILKAGRHLLQLINEVLEIARIESGRHTLSLEPVRLDGVLQEALALVRPLAAQWRVDLDEGPWSPEVAYVHADRQRLTQVLLNLLGNAIKYNRPGGRVWVRCEAVHRDGAPPHMAVRVFDTGRGIPADRADQLFTPFARLGAEQSQVEGTGLGLALSQRLAEAMGGTLVLESTGGEGSVFRLDLCGAADPVAALEDVPGAARSLDEGLHREANILYIEDNLANLSLIETVLLSRPRWRILPALQGRLGLEFAYERLPDLILLDLHLPDVSGEEIFHRLRADRRTASIPVVVISADATRKSVDRLLAAGVDAYLTKPLDIDEFMATMERFLGQCASEMPQPRT